MSSEKATAIVLRTVDFSETSLVVTLFTREFGKLGALAKGAKRPKNPFESALDVLTLCRIVFLHKSSEALDLLTEAKLLRRFRPPRNSPLVSAAEEKRRSRADGGLFSLYAGYYVAELLGELTHDNDPHPQLFDLADETLEALAAGEPVPRRVVRFELDALRLLGHAPSLDTCVACGAPVEPKGRVAFGHLDGGVLCGNCRTGRRHVAAVSAGTLRTMEQLADPHGTNWSRMEINQRTLGELRGVLNQYLVHLLGKKPRMHKYLGMLWN